MSPRSVAKADAIVVLGCKSSARLRRRVGHGVRLYQEGVAPVLLAVGRRQWAGARSRNHAPHCADRRRSAGGAADRAELARYGRQRARNGAPVARARAADGGAGQRPRAPATRSTAVSPRRGRGRRPIRGARAVAAGGRSWRRSAKWRRCRAASFAPFSPGEKAGGDDLAVGRKSEADRRLRSSAISFDRDCGERKARQ